MTLATSRGASTSRRRGLARRIHRHNRDVCRHSHYLRRRIRSSHCLNGGGNVSEASRCRRCGARRAGQGSTRACVIGEVFSLLPGSGWPSSGFGVAAGSAFDRASPSIKMLMGFSFLLIVMPSFAMWTSGWLLGYRGDIRRTALSVWRFNLAVALVLIFNGVSVYWLQICKFPSNPIVMTLCKNPEPQ